MVNAQVLIAREHKLSRAGSSYLVLHDARTLVSGSKRLGFMPGSAPATIAVLLRTPSPCLHCIGVLSKLPVSRCAEHNPGQGWWRGGGELSVPVQARGF